jgi:LysR family transcriptional regulator, glycine cleavage system transcriptional activator
MRGSAVRRTENLACEAPSERQGCDELPSLATLRTLEALSRHKRVGIAAQELGVSHAAVSRTVSRLELRYGVRLFERTSWGVEATPGCEGLIEAYLAAASALRRAFADVGQARRCRALIPLTAWRWLSPGALRLGAAFPDASIHTYQAGGAVDLAGADFAILPGEQLPAAGFDATPLYEERLIPVCAPAFAQWAKIETPAQLARAGLIVEQPELWRRWFRHAGFAIDPDLGGPIIADASLALEAALKGQGVALCCSLAVAAAIAQGDLVAPIDLSMRSGRRWWALWRQGSARDKTAMGILEWCLAELHAVRTAHAEIV